MNDGLVAENIAAARGGRLILSGLSFALAPGEALLITGRNGAGKTTLLRALAGLSPLAAGRARLQGDCEDIQARLHYVGHQDGLKGALTALENLEFWCDLLGDGGGLAPREALERFGLGPIGRIACSYLSAGQKRRVSLARLLTAPRPLWLLDEPTNALDVWAQKILVEAMQSHLAGDGMILVATHAPLAIKARELNLTSDGVEMGQQ